MAQTVRKNSALHRRKSEVFLKQFCLLHVVTGVRCFRLPILRLLPLLMVLSGVCFGDEPVKEGVDVLVYANGDRVHGKFISRENNTIIFESLHFGKIEVPATDARVLTAVAPTSVVTTTTVSSTSATPVGKTEGRFFAPSDWRLTGLTDAVRRMFGQWHGRLTLSSSSTINEKESASFVVDATITRKWAHDEVRIGARYDYGSSDNEITSDIVKSNSYWRHELSPRFFTLYSPTVEWNKAYTAYTPTEEVSVDYLLLQQQFGVGVNLITKGDQKLRVGIAENRFDFWILDPTQAHDTSYTESLFFEAELTLPYRIAITDRGSLFYSFANGGTGWENQLEISKKLTETLSLGMRHEVRVDTPGIDVTNYTLWRFMLGLDF